MKKSLVMLAAGVALSLCGAETLINDNFSSNAPGFGAPSGWNVYAKITELNTIEIKDMGGDRREVVLKDTDPQAEIGLTRALPATAGKFYRFSAKIRRTDPAMGSVPAIQIRFLPSNKFKQISTAANNSVMTANSVSMQAPEGTERLQVYLYSFKPMLSAYAISALKIEESDADFGATLPWPLEPSFTLTSNFTDEKVDDKTNLPFDWLLYKQGPDLGTVEATAEGVKMTDRSKSSEIGMYRIFAANPGSYFRATFQAKTLEGQAGSDSGFMLQVSFWKAKQTQFVVVKNSTDFADYVLTGQVPAEPGDGNIYIYSHKAPTNVAVFRNFKFEVSPTPFN